MIFNSVYARACMGAGLAVLTGIRGFLPVAFPGAFLQLRFQSAPVGEPGLGSWIGLGYIHPPGSGRHRAVLEKLLVFSTVRDRIMLPIKIDGGGLVFAAAALTGGSLCLYRESLAWQSRAWPTTCARQTRPTPTKDTTPIILLSIYEDVAVLVRTLLFVLLPLIGALVAFLVLLVYRVRVIET